MGKHIVVDEAQIARGGYRLPKLLAELSGKSHHWKKLTLVSRKSDGDEERRNKKKGEEISMFNVGRADVVKEGRIRGRDQISGGIEEEKRRKV